MANAVLSGTVGAARRALVNAVRGAVADLHVSRVHELLRNLGTQLCESPAEAQATADAAGCAATRCHHDGWRSESLALRRVSRDVLEGLLSEWGGHVHHERFRRSRHCSALEQLLVRHLETSNDGVGIGNNDDFDGCPRRAAELAARGAELCGSGRDTAASKRFEVARNLAEFHVAVSKVDIVDSATLPVPLFDVVERHAKLSPEEYLEFFSRRSLPVIVRNQHCLPGEWGFQELKEACGKRRVMASRYDPLSREWAGIRSTVECTLEELLESWRSASSEADRGVLFDEPLALACPELLQAWRWPTCVTQNDLIRRSAVVGVPKQDPFCGHPSLFVQPAGSRCGLHVDSFRTQFAQSVLRGRKRWIFWPLGDVDQVRYLGRRDEVRLEVYRRRRADRVIHFEQSFPPSMADSPREELQLLRVEVEVGAGETILVPGGVPHQVVNLEDTIAVSQNFADASHAHRTASELRWPVPYDQLANFLEETVNQRTAAHL
eukprot:TRINITY_DN32294_c0_g1_i1.p1 TRINITY_DN32294_c0_g1~~TRINITY_DN32294_c0_g1_i1.p1  ORF type:complete len:493 (+),score=69.26 TRINITY_DN32294_c0_g1_i1:108-1586(+)